MGPELWVGVVAAFVGGGAIGSAGTLLAQWILRRVDAPPPSRHHVGATELDALRAEVADMSHHIHNLDARLDFTERLLDGALPLAPPPGRPPDADPSVDG